MNNQLIERLCLGTAQFGSDYGIANKSGKITSKEAFKILEYAYSHGIKTIDTAYSYGDSEKVIGRFMDEKDLKFKIISKLPSLSEFNSKDIETKIRTSLARLRQKTIYAYLIHRSDDFLKHGKLWNALEDLKKEKPVKKIGFSIYRTQELYTIFDKDINFDIIQVPYSIFDRRFEKYFKKLKDKGVKIYARSVFLQGLAFLKPSDLPENLKNAEIYLERLQNLVSENNISINALCLNFVLLNPHVDKVIIGVDSLEHLVKNLEDLNLIEKVKGIYSRLDKPSIKDENILLPYKWNVR